MENYNFSTLNDKEFELIAKDLLNAKYMLKLQSFSTGKDKGVDLRYSTPKNNNSIVVQVKHYHNSGFSQLKHTLSKVELQKIKSLKPDRYIVVTSLSLSAIQKDTLKNELEPFVLNSNDIIGQEDLNSYLSEFKEIEKKYFKLWFSSVNIFNKIINNAIEGRTKDLLEKIKSKANLYVITNNLDEANKILRKEKILLVTGQPGIGKTTLAEIIIFEKAKKGFQIIKVENIQDAEDMFSPDKTTKQLFYFDDFLGSNYLEIINAHRTETQLTSFVDRIKGSPNKYLLLTTRTIILNHAIERYEKISRSKLAERQFEIKLDDYGKYQKALILYNHVYFKNIKSKIHEAILKDRFYKIIIQHKNYTPRIIEFITDNSRIKDFSPKTYKQFVLGNLNNPKEIWRYSYNNQIGYLEQRLLITLLTLGNSAVEPILEEAFQARLKYEAINHNQIIGANQFINCVKILLNGFISSTLYDDTVNIRHFNFINPSLADFLISFIAESLGEKRSIISSVIYIEQLEIIKAEESLFPLELDMQLILLNRITNNEILPKKSRSYTKNRLRSMRLKMICEFCNSVNIDAALLKIIKKIDFTTSWEDIQYAMEYTLLNIGNSPETFNYIKENFITIIEKLMDVATLEDDVSQIVNLFEMYEHSYEEYTDSDEGFNKMLEVNDSILNYTADLLKSDKRDEVFDMDDVDELYKEVWELEERLNSKLFPNMIFNKNLSISIDEDFWNDAIQENIDDRAKAESVDYDDNAHYVNNSKANTAQIDDLIDDLFVKCEI